MAEEDSKGSHETNAVRLSFRTTETAYQKIVRIGKEKGWINAKGRPNVSAVLNFVIDRFEEKEEKAKKKRKKNG